MSARLLATFCLVLFSVPATWAQSASSQDAELVVYLRAGATPPAAPLAHMKHELASLMRSAGYRIQWANAGEATGDSAEFLVVLDLEGACFNGARTDPGVSLATTNVTDGNVLPFSTIHCGVVNRSVAATLGNQPAAQRDYLYGRALARIAAHEFYHVLTRSVEHATGGVARSCFSTEDLLTERFQFEGATLARLRSVPPTVPALTEEATDR